LKHLLIISFVENANQTNALIINYRQDLQMSQ